MNDKDTGGTAFPSHGSMGEVAQEGMDLLDYFAGQALPALIADCAPEIAAQFAYRYSRAMLAERAKA